MPGIELLTGFWGSLRPLFSCDAEASLGAEDPSEDKSATCNSPAEEGISAGDGASSVAVA